MHVYRSWEPATVMTVSLGRGGERLDVQRRQETADVMGVPRCPQCGGELVARMGRARPFFWCRCPVRRGNTAA
jgi:ssDNA-binding Zn-finger/Zn-ribbon topoisomerase 1